MDEREKGPSGLEKKNIKKNKKQETPAQSADGQEKSKDSNDKQKKDEEKKVDSEEKNLNPSNKKDFLELFKIASSPKLNQKDLQKVLDFGVELRTQNKITEKQFQNLKVLVEKRLELGKANKKIEEMNKNYAKRFGGFMPSKEWQEIPSDGIPIPPGGNIEMNMSTGKNKVRWNDPYEGMPAKEKEEMGKLLKGKQRLEEELNLQEDLKKESPKKKEKTKETSRKESGKDKDKIKEKPGQERKAQGETFKNKVEKESAYQNLIREISKAHEGRYYPKDDAERIEAERRIKELEMKREEYIRYARAEGWLDEKTVRKVEVNREGATKGKMFFNALLEESSRLIPDPEGIPKELRGVNQDYYQKEVLKIIGEKSTPTDKKQQEERLREYLKILRTIRLAPQSIQSNPIWIEMISAIAYFHPELQKEFKARLEIFQYGLNFKENAEGVETGIAGSSRVRLSHIGRVLKVPEIQKAYDLLEENAQINVGEIIESYDVSKTDELERKIRAGEERGERNPLYAGSEAQRKETLDKIALKLAEAFGEKAKGLSDKEKANLAEKYMWAVDEAEDVWRITARADETDINMEGKGGQFWLNRLFHFPARLKNKGFGYESTRKYFNKPFLPVWVEGEPILPVLKGEKLEISGADIEIIRKRLKTKSLDQKEIEKRIRIIKGKLLKGRGLMMKGFWEYQIDYLLKKKVWLKIKGREQEGNGLQKIGFNKEDVIRYTRDGNGRELPYIVYRKEFISPSGEKKEMVVRVSVDKKDKDKDVAVIDIENPSAEILSEICQQVPEGFYGSYVGDWIVKAEITRKLLESGILKIPPGSEGDMERLLSDLRSKGLFDHLDPLSKDKERKPGKYYQEDAWEDFLRGAVDFGLHEGRHMFERWHMWGAWNAGVLIKKATDLKVITDDQGIKIENEMLPFLGMRGNIPRWLRCNFDRFTMFYRWGPGRGMILLEMLKEFFQGILPELPSAPKRK
ncbi:hypothetical protein MUP35_02435 [Patescibacteria group bacterium]|nr:hypothetical protein [Patescibacteria group bacterium]